MEKSYCQLHAFSYLREDEFGECPLCKADYQNLLEEYNSESILEDLHEKESEEV